MTRSEILDKAKEIVNGQREQDYGAVENNFGLIGQLWTVYLDHLVTAADVANMMCLFKIARIKTGRGTEDSYIDAVGYMACGGEIATEGVAEEKPTSYLEKATAAMRPKYIQFLKTQIEKQTDDKHEPTCCTCEVPTTEDIAKIAEDNEYKRELLNAIFRDDTEEPHTVDVITDMLRKMSDILYRYAYLLEEEEDEEDED